jgi:hypothetical protein
MIDRFLYRFFSLLDDFFDKFISDAPKKKEKEMIKNFKDIVILLITSGVLILLGVIIIGDYWVALEENRPVDESVITLNEDVSYRIDWCYRWLHRW